MKNGVFLLLALLPAACASSRQPATMQDTPKPAATLLIDARGVGVPLRDAVKQIAFRPLIPGNQLVSIALIPPLGGTDGRESHGVAIEYASAGDALLLSEWPRLGFDVTGSPCAPVAYKSNAFVWTTRNGLVMTLQPDGAVPPSRITREVRRLMRAGGCRTSR
jgi:hypothetical protein